MQPIQPNVSKLVGAGCQLTFGTIFTLIALFVLLGAWSVNAPWYFLLFASVFVLFGLSLVGRSLWVLLVKRMVTGTTFGPAAAALSSYDVRLGEAISVQYEQAAARTVQVRRVLIQLVLREHATYRRGKSTRTVVYQHIMAQHEGADRSLARNEMLTETCTLRVPPTSMHSLETPHNTLTWIVRVQIDVPNMPDVTEEIGFRVVPDFAEGVA